jgi:hypothetical protein
MLPKPDSGDSGAALLATIPGNQRLESNRGRYVGLAVTPGQINAIYVVMIPIAQSKPDVLRQVGPQPGGGA